ncbi:DeoR/GlpR family DNA-binding transcription regulator [Gracilibacillus alcaliphilus]|uniref:DeoR/GlpR family DNA-binding transcription regulator n=1 Tax=Gracilibacillus alcaliphilus TaxID=1401441 RepID=UPI00195E9EFE|nr:DeoR/GlpR family DNA-binding transcription regulator [Gracilibacillus alcaliphilus]MBM7677158.1 DeoR/GlpR family transcriptional regulator of sugar metabolism [Gracilibacillus alcaliphilus]
MEVNERRDELLEIIKKENKVFISDLAKKLNVSEITIRRDLELLDKENQIIRIRGGAKWLDPQTHKDTNFLNERYYRQSIANQKGKAEIGKCAASLIKPNETIVIDAGSTAMELAKNIKDVEGVTAIVTAINIAEELEGRSGIQTIITGGVFRSRTTTLLNPLMNGILMQVVADKVFLGISALSLNRGFSGNDILEAEVKSQLLKSGKEVIWLVDSSKLNKESTIQIAALSKTHTVIVDDGIDMETKKNLQSLCHLIVAPRNG